MLAIDNRHPRSIIYYKYLTSAERRARKFNERPGDPGTGTGNNSEGWLSFEMHSRLVTALGAERLRFADVYNTSALSRDEEIIVRVTSSVSLNLLNRGSICTRISHTPMHDSHSVCRVLLSLRDYRPRRTTFTSRKKLSTVHKSDSGNFNAKIERGIIAVLFSHVDKIAVRRNERKVLWEITIDILIYYNIPDVSCLTFS